MFRTTAVYLSNRVPVFFCFFCLRAVIAGPTLCVQTYHASFICELAHPFRQDLVDVPVFLKESGFFRSPGSSQQNILSALWI